MLLRNKAIGKHIVPIIPDEARTFGMDALFREIRHLFAQRPALRAGRQQVACFTITKPRTGRFWRKASPKRVPCRRSSPRAPRYATHGVNMIPFYIYYSMFGFQRIGDLMWLAGDIKAKGFLLGATAGRTTLNGEGLATSGRSQPAAREHHSDAADLRSGVRLRNRRDHRAMACGGCIEEGEDIFYYLDALQRKSHDAARCRQASRKAFSKGFINSKPAPESKKHKAHIFGSGPIINAGLARARNSRGDDTTSPPMSGARPITNSCATTRCMRDRWNMLHPTETPKKSYRRNLAREGEEARSSRFPTT